MEKKNQKREIILAICGVFMLIAIVVGTSYAVFTFSEQGKIENTITTGTVAFSYNEATNGISLTNAEPMTDAAGKLLVEKDLANGIEQGYFDFNVGGNFDGNSNVIYEVYATIDPSSTMNPSFVKVYLTDGSSSEVAYPGYDGEKVPVYSSLETSENDPDGKMLYKETVTDTKLSKNFRLRIWVADTYEVADESKTFSLKVNVKAMG